MKLFFRFLHWAVFRLRLYVAWSWLYNALWSRSYRKVIKHIPRRTLDEAQKLAGTLSWQADSWRGLWDAISAPEVFEFWVSCVLDPPTEKSDPRYDLWVKKGRQPPKHDRDCDDFARWMLATVGSGKGLGAKHPNLVMHSYFLNVVRYDESKSLFGKFWGHNVILHIVADGDMFRYYVGGNDRLHRCHEAFYSLADAVEDVSPEKSMPLVAWAVLDGGMRLLCRSSKQPSTTQQLPNEE